MLRAVQKLHDRVFKIAALLLFLLWAGLFWIDKQWAPAFLIVAAYLWLAPQLRKASQEEEALRDRLEQQQSKDT